MENFRILNPSQPIEGLSLHSGGQSREVAVIQSEAKDLMTFAGLLGFRKVLWFVNGLRFNGLRFLIFIRFLPRISSGAIRIQPLRGYLF
ncbi:hypothetical protein [Siphonobacter sp. SORGH_AS_1065]|uniref:hypothetical protein n=1 Tax=Siphonobacter sp. SORGH_AS_1065 TaxID=3041795 RepID=UPI000CB753AA|nr:hypothetical protein [Siphonobacter sp. SORGH_AS_1065]MDQ1090266.1 hypothetical protein [Siphonobacter sp. SORGH_AS_1065]PKK34983.1 hypothetical protein BWI96_19325 [Siphonobacter sp. SORGH_AS_0500]